jgi:hypothetical protein
MLTDYEIAGLRWKLQDADIRGDDAVSVPVDMLRELLELWSESNEDPD